MKILIITKSFYPTIGPRSFRATELTKNFAKNGHDVEVLTHKNDKYHIKFEGLYNVKITSIGGDFIFTKGVADKWYNLLKYIYSILSHIHLASYFDIPDIMYMYFVRKWFRRYKKKEYDLIISIAKPHSIHWGLAMAFIDNKQIAKQWIADCGDPYINNPITKRFFYYKKFEKLFCDYASFISVPIENAKNAYDQSYRDKIKVIPQGFNFTEDKKCLRIYKKNNIPTFAFAGNIYPKFRDPSKFLEYLLALDMDYRFLLYTKSANYLASYINKSEGRIICNDYVEREDLLGVLSKMDFLVNINNLHNVQAPSKLIDYYLVGRPVLMVDSGKVPIDNINDFLHGDYREAYVFRDMEQYEIDVVCKSFIKCFYEKYNS